MTNSPKKHIIDSLLREIYGEKSPPDQTDAILRRLESGDSNLLTETRSESYASDSGPYPTIRSDAKSSAHSPVSSPKTNWIVIAATVVFCVGLIGAMAKVLMQSDENDQMAETTADDPSESGALKHSKSLAVKQSPSKSATTQPPNNGSSGETKLAKNPAQPNNTKSPTRNTGETAPFSTNPLPTFAENANRLGALEVKSRIDSSLAKNWHVHVIESPQSISGNEWIRRVFNKLLGRAPESNELAKLKQYVSEKGLLSPDMQLRVIETIMSDESTSREFAHHWADRFMNQLSRHLPAGSDGNNPRTSREFSALKSFLRQAVVKGEPLNEMARQMIVANGSVDPQAIEFNGAAGFVAMAGNDPNLLAENISRSFLGTELTCAKCHADSVHEQSRTDYLGLAAFLQGTNVTRKQTGVPVVSELPTNRKVPGLFFSSRSGLAVYAAPLIAGHDAELNQKQARKSLADQLVRSDRFAKAMVNWVWTEIYGYGLAREGRINQTVNAPHQMLMTELSEQLVANDFDLRVIVKWAMLAKPFSARGKPSADTLTKDIPKYGGVAFFSYLYEQLEHDPKGSVSRLAKAYQEPEGLTSSARLSLNVKAVGKGLEIIDQMENGVLPNGLKIEDEVPEFARGWGVESVRVQALDRIADSKTLAREQKIEHLYLMALHRSPTRTEKVQAGTLFKPAQPIEGQPKTSSRPGRQVLQDLWWAIYPR